MMVKYCEIARKMFWILLLVLLQVLHVWFSIQNEGKELNEVKRNLLSPEGKTSDKKTRLNVIILTHMSSGSTFLGNLFNLHRDVFYHYEPLNELRMKVHGDRRDLGEWNVLDEKGKEAYRSDLSNLLRDLFACNFERKNTVNNLFPHWLRTTPGLLAWGETTNYTKESLRTICLSRRITVAKIMQTRFVPGETGIRELQRICSSEPKQFKCLIIHLVRDPRACISSLILNKFYMPKGPSSKLITLENTSLEGREMILHKTRIMCSLFEDNLNYVNEEWSKWFKGRYVLLRYEDIPGDLLTTVAQLYNFTGLNMTTVIMQWIQTGILPGVKMHDAAFIISKKDPDRVGHWRSRLDISLVTQIEGACWPLMYMMGYTSVNGSEHILHDTSHKLLTEKMPFLFPQKEQKQ